MLLQPAQGTNDMLGPHEVVIWAREAATTTEATRAAAVHAVAAFIKEAEDWVTMLSGRPRRECQEWRRRVP
jgi:hypothetical protein